MCNQKSLINLDYKPKLPVDRSKGIAIIGAGDIVQSNHLPAYRMAGFNVIGIYDLNIQRVQKVAEEFELVHVFESLHQLLEHPEVDVVDIAVPAKYQPDFVEQVTAKGKHVLCQKPLGLSI